MYIYNYQSFTFIKPLQWSEIKAASLVNQDTAISDEDYVHEILHQLYRFSRYRFQQSETSFQY